MKKIVITLALFIFTVSLYGQKKSEDLIKVILIKNNGDSVFIQSKSSYYNEVCFNSFGYYNDDGSRGRAHADEFSRIIMKDKYLESVYLKSTIKEDCDKQVFLERLIDGPMIMYLYSYKKEMGFTTKCIDEIYIRKANEKCAYPVYKEPCINTLVVSQPKNTEDILILFEDTPQIIEKINSGEYHREDFEKIVLEYNSLIKD